jgi:hypothetical protein
MISFSGIFHCVMFLGEMGLDEKSSPDPPHP